MALLVCRNNIMGAVSEMKKQIGCSDEHDTLIRSYLADRLIHDEDSFIENGKTIRVCIWWDSNQFPKV